MSTRRGIGIFLVVLSLGLGYLGLNKISKNSASIKVLDLKVDLSNSSGKEQGYSYAGLSIMLLGGGLYLLKKEK